MKIAVRQGVFETNSSSEHSVSVNLGNFSITRYIDDYDDEITFSEDEIEDLLHTVPSKMLEKELERRKELFSELTLEDLEYEIKRRKNELSY